jgi:hypothetical protein
MPKQYMNPQENHMTIREIVEIARRMMRELRNGLRRACHYLASLGLSVEFASWALLGR